MYCAAFQPYSCFDFSGRVGNFTNLKRKKLVFSELTKTLPWSWPPFSIVMRTAVFAAGLVAVGIQGAAAFSPVAIAQVRPESAPSCPSGFLRAPPACPCSRESTFHPVDDGPAQGAALARGRPARGHLAPPARTPLSNPARRPSPRLRALLPGWWFYFPSAL
jgi:hypothetical protein